MTVSPVAGCESCHPLPVRYITLLNVLTSPIILSFFELELQKSVSVYI